MNNNDGIKSFNDLAAKSDKPLTLEQAIGIFDHLADMEEIAFGYADDGCHARAHLMCRRMMFMGLTPKKAWAFEKGGDKLTVGIDGQKLRWWFHVAAALSVQMPDGTVQDMVIDPGLFDGPVSLKQWGDIMKAPPEKLQIVAFDAPPAGYTGAYTPNDEISSDTDEKAKKTMDTYLNRQRTPPRKVFASESRQQVSQMQNTQSQAQGKTWVSIAVPETPTDTSPEKKARDTGWGFDQN